MLRTLLWPLLTVLLAVPFGFADSGARGCFGEIHGTKYRDLNCDGVRDAGEPGLAGWTIALSGVIDTTVTTNVNGDYVVVVPAGAYQVTEVTQPCWILTDPVGGAHSVSVDCDEVVSGVDFGNCLCEEPSERLPSCLVAWYPFDEGAGASTLELVNATTAAVNGPGWVFPGQIAPHHLDFSAPGDRVDAPPPAYPNFGPDDFAVAAWVRTSNADPSPRTLVDKTAFTGPGNTGWHLYLQGTRLAIDLADGSTSTSFVSTGASLATGTWNHVVAVVCRDTGPGTGGVTFYVNGAVDDAFPSAGMPVGSYDAAVPLRLGDRSPGLPPSAPLIAELDELMLFQDCCLDPSQVAALTSLRGFATGQCEVPSTVSACGPTAPTTLKICNHSAVPRTYTWTIAGNPIGAGCTVAGPTTFSPNAGTVTIPAGTCQQIPITITLPPGFGGTDVACYTATVYEHETGRCFKCDGKLRPPTWLWASPATAFDDFVAGQTVTVQFNLENTGASTAILDLEFRPWSRGDDGPSPTLSLDGLPPGEPIVRTVKLPPESIEPVTFNLKFEEHQAFVLHEVQMLADPGATGTPEVVCVMGVSSLPGGGAVSATPVIALPSSVLAVAPNPFSSRTAVRFQLDRSGPATVRVYDVAGRLVRTLVDRPLGRGSHAVVWDGATDSGRAAAGGVYWLRLDSVAGSGTKSVVRMR